MTSWGDSTRRDEPNDPDAMTVAKLFEKQGLQPSGPKAWGDIIPCDEAGVYVVALDPNPTYHAGLTVPANLRSEVAERWLPGQPIVYIGKAGGPNFKATVRTRIKQFYYHKYGKPKPHKGGQDLKLLLEPSIDLPLWLFWAPTPNPRDVEKGMLTAFRERTGGRRPFANRQD